MTRYGGKNTRNKKHFSLNVINGAEMMEKNEVPPSLNTEEECSAKDDIWCLQRVGRDCDWLQLFEDSEVSIGRGLNVTYQILSVSCPLMISRNHCVFKQNEAGLWTVTDNKSLNGVWVNGRRIAPGSPCLLHLGDSVRLGVPLDGNPVEFDYILVQRNFSEVKSFLSGNQGKESSAASSGQKLKNSKRKFDGDESESCPTQHSKSKLYRLSGPDKSRAQPCPPEERKKSDKYSSRPLEVDRSGDIPGSSSCCSESSQHLATVHNYNKNLMVLKDRVGDTQKRAAELQRQQYQTPERECEMQELQAQLELLRGQLRSQQEQALKRIESLEKSFCEEERRLEIEKAQQNEEGLKKQLEEALHEHRKVIDELKHAREGFKEVLQAKDKELEVTKEEKEKAKAQKEEVVTQMTEVLESELQCSICSELFIEAVTLSCAHSFCQHCIREWRCRKDKCPMCWQTILSQTRSLVLDNCIDRMVENLSADMRERRAALITERKGLRAAVAPAVVVIPDDSSSSDTSIQSNSSTFEDSSELNSSLLYHSSDEELSWSEEEEEEEEVEEDYL
ncbi:E3 ubiquitin-protein ligase rnf8-like isoform X1 [Xyrauchen texanus]|uniref:E3 ubiquitin-protein ligase rnf8-like isoform X1 n=1 Tax=Xyrauchen texanus TaxID=154827 RepID=UPI002242ACCE|nr:E3 ubiquitin-protein ligase rnf8-like isoform X1 [Xyrauchen texanus]